MQPARMSNHCMQPEWQWWVPLLAKDWQGGIEWQDCVNDVEQTLSVLVGSFLVVCHCLTGRWQYAVQCNISCHVVIRTDGLNFAICLCMWEDCGKVAMQCINHCSFRMWMCCIVFGATHSIHCLGSLCLGMGWPLPWWSHCCINCSLDIHDGVLLGAAGDQLQAQNYFKDHCPCLGERVQHAFRCGVMM